MFQLERDGLPPRLLLYAGLPLAYVITGRLGLVLAVPPGYATAVFLPAGIAIAASFMAGAATLPAIFVARSCSISGPATRLPINSTLRASRWR